MKAIVTGGAGFLGKHLVERLVKDGHSVRALDLPSAELDELKKIGVETIPGDIRDAGLVARVCRGMDFVFHIAALASPWGPRELFWEINVGGTDNVIQAGKKAGVRRLVFVSSPSAIFDGKDHFDADESLPYPTRFLSHYSETKAISEQRLLSANSPDLETVAIRPHAIWGPRDRHLLPRVIARAKSGRLFQIGDGANQVSTLYVENAVDALLLAAEAKPAPGKVYFIVNDEPVRLWDFIRRILRELDLPGPRGTLPYPVAYSLAMAYEAIWKTFRLKGEPNLTRYTAAELARNHTYSIARARQDLGFKPRFSLEQGFSRTLAWIKEKGIPRPPKG